MISFYSKFLTFKMKYLFTFYSLGFDSDVIYKAKYVIVIITKNMIN